MNKGEKHTSARLTAAKVRIIRDTYQRGKPGFSYYALAKHFGVSHVAIFKVVNRQSWKEIP